MKIIRIIFFSLSALSLIICAGIFIFFQTFDTDQYLQQITRKASLVIGRPVSIGHVGPGLSLRGITLDAGPLIISDDPDFTTQPFIKVDKARISLDFRSLILRREIHITGILLQSPQIHFIRSPQGQINVQSIGKPGQPAGVVDPMMTIQDASISFIDQNQTFPMDIWLTGIDASASVSLEVSKRSVRISGLSLLTDLSRLDIKEFKDISPNIAGVVQLNMAHLDTGPSGLEAKGDISITDGVIKNFNIIKTLFSSMLGAFGGSNIDHLLNGQLKNQLGAPDTVIKKARGQFSLHDKTVFIDDSLIETNIFEFTAKGPVDQGLNLGLQTTLHLNEDVSAALVNEFDGFKYLMDDSKRITVDASLQGVIPHLKYKPNKDFRKKGKKFLIEEGGNILNALLGGK